MAKLLTDETALQLTEALLQNDKDIKTNLESKFTVLETDKHSHDNKDVLDTITVDKVNAWDNKAELSDIPSIQGLATETFVTTSIANAQLSGGDVDLSGYYTKDEAYSKGEVDTALENKADVSDIPDISNLATTEYVDNAVQNVSVNLDGYATEAFVTDKIAEIDIPDAYDDTALIEMVENIETALDDKADKSSLDDLVTTEEMNTAIANAQLSGSDVNLTGYYTKTETDNAIDAKIEELNLGEDNVIESISVDGVALTPDENGNVNITMPTIPSNDGLVTEEALAETLANYAKNDDIPTHANQEVLDKLSESDTGTLLFDGNEIQGDSGTQGADGKSAYEIAQDNGFEGTEEEWLESLKGDIGETGKDGKSIISIETDEDNYVIVTYSDNTTQSVGQLNMDIRADFLTEGGFGNLRYYNSHFQYYDATIASWIDTSVTPENVYLINMIPQAMKRIIGIYDVELGYNKLKFEEPSDTIIENQSACIVEKIIIRRKLGSAPVDETDGIFVAEINRANFGKHKNAWYIDESFTPSYGEVWYYKAFPVSTTGFVNTISLNETSILCKDHYLFGFKLDQNESDPASMITYIEDNTNYKSAYMDYTTDSFNYGDWEDAWFIRDLKPCMLNYDGTVAYELDKNDYSLKADGTPSDIANDSFGGNAMIGFPKVYWKIVDNGDDTANIYFSNKKVDEDFVCWSHIDNNGNEIDYCYMPIYNGSNVNSRLRSISGKTPINTQTGTTEITYALANNQTSDIIWYTEIFSDRQLVNLLLLLIGKSTDTQSVFGNGHYTGGSSASNLLVTGTLNDKGLFYGTNGTGKGVKVFGIEHWWGNKWRRIAGWINDKGTQKIKMTYGQSDGSTVNGYNTDGTGYINIDCAPVGTSGYISKMAITENILIPTTASGSATTYYTDGLWFKNSQVSYALVGCNSRNEMNAGALCISLGDLISNTSWSYGASISCKPLSTT